MRSDRFKTQRGRVMPPFRFKLLSMDMRVAGSVASEEPPLRGDREK
jgi:hypothetical protein